MPVGRRKVVLPVPDKVAGAKADFGILGAPSAANRLIPHSCMLHLSLSCLLLGHSPTSQRMEGVLRRVRTINRMKGRMLKTHCKLCLGMTNKISRRTRLPSSPKHSQSAPTAHASPSRPPESQTLLHQYCRLMGHSDMEGRQRPTQEPTIFPGPLSFPHWLAGPSLQLQTQPCPQGWGVSLDPWDA